MNDLLGMKILVVDDDITSVQLLSKILKKVGYKNTEICRSGDEALDFIRRNPPDLVLLDIIMPGTDGYEVCRQIRREKNTRELPIIMVTGGAEDADHAIQKSFEAGATDFITKPIRRIEFIARVKSALIIKQAYNRMNEELRKRKQLEKEREKVISELQEALDQVKTLSGMLPICASCKRIRDDKGYWNQVEAYIQKHSEIQFTHGLCPECAKKLYPDIYKKKDNKA